MKKNVEFLSEFAKKNEYDIIEKMNSQDLIKSIVNNFYDDDKLNIMYLCLSENLMKKCVSNDSDVLEIDLCEETIPLSPFLTILSKLKISDELLKKSAYGLQYETFKSFFKKGFPEDRNDSVIFEEIDYEKIRMRETIIALLEKCFCGRVIVFNSQLMSDDVLKILSQLENSTLKGKFIFCFNNLDMEKKSSAMKNFFQKITKQKNYYSINTLEDFSEEEFTLKPEKKEIDYQKIYRELKSYSLFLDIEKGYEVVKEIDHSNILVNANIEDARHLYMEMGIIAFFYGDTDLASFYFNNVIEYQIDDEVDCYALYYLALVFSRKNMNSVALKYISKAIAKSKNFLQFPVYALAVMMDYIITERTDSEYSAEKYFNALEQLEKFGLTNNHIYTSLVVPYGVIYDSNLRKGMRVRVEKSMKDAENLGNKFGLSIACHWMGIMMTHDGRKEDALFWYKKCFKLRKEMGDFSSLMKVINGLSYEYLIDTKYLDSYNLINDVSTNLLENKDYSEIIITLYNLARTCFYSRNFELASELFQTILNLLSLFEVSDLYMNSFLPELNDIIAYRAMLDFYRGEFIRAKMNLHNMQNNGKPFTTIEEFVKFFLDASLRLEENNKDEAIKIFEKCISDFFAIGVTQEHRIVFMIYEFANFLEQKGFYKDAENYLARGFKIAKEKNLVNYTKQRNSITLKEYLDGAEKFQPLKISLAALEEKAEKERLLIQLHKQLRNSKFLNKISTNNINDFNDSRFASNIVQAVFDYTMADAVFLAEKKEHQWTTLGVSVRENIKQPSDSEWESLVQCKKLVEIKKVKDEDRQMIFMNLSRFEFVGGMIIYLQKKFLLNSEEMNIISIAAANIQAQLVMLKQNEHLAIISATDQLSMLNNRRALHNHLSLESEMIRRYEKKRNLYMHDAISFIDLDNFKYYNDTFGHEAGDLLIAAFAKLLKEIYRKVDFVARFGGDEFVVVLPNTNCSEAARAAERLYEGLEKKEHFLPELEKLVGKKLDIPQEKKLGFSMGISSNSDENDISDLDTTMTNADKALYYSKQHKKGSVTIWADIKDEFNESKMLARPER